MFAASARSGRRGSDDPQAGNWSLRPAGSYSEPGPEQPRAFRGVCRVPGPPPTGRDVMSPSVDRARPGAPRLGVAAALIAALLAAMFVAVAPNAHAAATVTYVGGGAGRTIYGKHEDG